jgi:beta-glucanase (GH16 family)
MSGRRRSRPHQATSHDRMTLMLRQRFFLNRRVLGIAVVAVVVGVSFLSSSTIPHASAATGPLVWSDEFNGTAGTAPDTGKWGRDLGGGGFGNNELEYYTNGADNAAMDGQGNLVITARKENPAGYRCWYGSCQYTSARLNTAGRFTQQYGHIEARIKMPRGQGIWPAFWALGDNIGQVGWPASGEIDIMESVGRTPSTNYGSLHGPGYSGGNPLTGSYTLPGGQKFADDFHTFAVDWSPNVVSWSVDGNQYSRHTSADTNGNPWVYNHPFFLILNVAVGGTFPGNPDGSSTYPQRMLVDYVRVHAQDSGGGGGGAITGYGGKCVDVAGANSANGTQVQLYTCNGTNAQKWTRVADTLRALGKCLDVSGAGTANGTRVQLYDCNGTNAQRWTVGTDGTLRAMDKCLDATGVSSADGTPLQIWDCTGGANQKWSIRA